MKEQLKRGDIFYADLGRNFGTEQCGVRPVVIIQNNIANRYSPTTIIAPITCLLNKAKLPTHVKLLAEDSGLNCDSVILLDQIKSIDKKRLKEKICNIHGKYKNEIDKALMISLSISTDQLPKVEKKLKETSDQSSNEIKKFSQIDPKKEVSASIIKENNPNSVSDKNSNDLKAAINILQNILERNSSKEISQEVNIEDEYKDINLNQIYSDMAKLTQKVECMHTDMKPFLRKTSIAKGILNEQAVIDYFNNIEKPRHKKYEEENYLYEAGKADEYLDSLKIDVIARNRKNKIFIQVKAGKIKLNELETVVENIKNLDIKYNEENLNKIACICADTFPQDIELQRLDLEEKYNIKIMLIHKYQILQLDSCKRYERAIK